MGIRKLPRPYLMFVYIARNAPVHLPHQQILPDTKMSNIDRKGDTHVPSAVKTLLG